MHHVVPETDRHGYDTWRGVFEDPEAEAAFRQLRFDDHVRGFRSVWAAGFAVWWLLVIYNVMAGDLRLALHRSATGVIFTVFGLRPRTVRELDLTMWAGTVGLSIGLCGVFVLSGTPDAFVLCYMLVLTFGPAFWAVSPTRVQASATLINVVAPSAVLIGRGTDPVRVVVFGVLVFGWSLVVQSGASIRERRLQAGLWKTAQLIEERERLLATIAHELRTPLASALMAVEVGLQTPARREELLERMRSRLLHLRALIDALLDFGGLGQGPAERRQVPLGVLVHEVAEDLSDLHDGIDVCAEGEAELHGDPDLLRSAVVALGVNAARYARKRVVIRVGVDGEQVRIDVDDDGPGVPAAHRGRIFEPLYRVERGGPHGGIGMGLAVARRIFESHGGSLAVGDGPLGGARFTAELPVGGPLERVADEA